MLGLRLIFSFCLVGMPLAAAANTLSAGVDHTVVVKPDGTVWTWGDNTYGQLGYGLAVDRPVPGPVPTIADGLAVAAGGYHTLLLRSDGSVWSWGHNSYGQLGDGTTTQRRDPVPVTGLSNVIALAAGDFHSVALTSDGRVWTWGVNWYGQLGDGSTTLSKQPVLVTALTSITAIGAGAGHTLAVTSGGHAWAWGANGNGRLGDGTTTQRTSPVQMSGVSGASAVAGGSTHSLILKADGTVLGVGNNGSGQVGDGSWTQRTTPVAVSSLTNVTTIAAGYSSAYAVTADGSVRAWGSNMFGQLGDGTTTSRNTATLTSNLSGITTAAAGQNHGVAVTSDGVVWAWGYNVNGQIGDGTTRDRWTPVAISGPNYDWNVSTPVFSVAAGTYTTEKTVVLTAATPDAFIHYTLTGDVPAETDAYVMSGGTVPIDQPRTLKARAFKTGMPASSVATSVYTLAVASISFSPYPTTYTTSQIVSLSSTSPGVAIRYTLNGSTPTESSTLYTAALAVGSTTTINAIGLRANWTSSAVATGTFTMNFGTLAMPMFSPAPGTHHNDVALTLTAMPGATIRYAVAPQTVSPFNPIYTAPLPITATTTMNVGAYHPDYTWSGQASGAYTLVVAPPVLSHPAGTYVAGQVVTITSVTQGAVLRYTLNGATPTTSHPVVPAGGIVAGNFTLKVAGWKTGYTPTAVVTATYQVTGSLTTPRLEAGDAHSLAVRGDGSVWAWGTNSSYQLGDGTTTQRTLPILVNVSGVVEVSGSGHSLTRRSDGSLVGWGYNSFGQLGNGTTATGTGPVSVPGVTQAVGMSAGGYHTLTLESDGTVWAFGQNSNGQLGDGTTTLRLTAVQASGLSNVIAIGAGAVHSVALRADGTVWTWGQNGNGQLGTGNTTSRSTAGTIALPAATAIAAGSYHNLAVLADGTVRAWGTNGFGELGNGTQTGGASPVVVSELTSATAVAAGVYFSLALKADGTVWAWGYNFFGQLGDGTTTTRTTPVAVQGLPAITAIAAGGYHALALGVDGAVWAWGNNANGQLGDGTTTSRPIPVQIANAGMVWKIPTPVLSVVSGLYVTEQSVTVTSGDPGAVLRYTTTGVTPTDADATVGSGSAVSIPQSLTLKVRAFKPGAVVSEVAVGTYELKGVAPMLTPATGTYVTAQAVGISTTTQSATLRYTTDGSEPTSTSTAYSGAVTVSDTRTLKARAYRTGWTPSDSTASSLQHLRGHRRDPDHQPGNRIVHRDTAGDAGVCDRGRHDPVHAGRQYPDQHVAGLCVPVPDRSHDHRHRACVRAGHGVERDGRGDLRLGCEWPDGAADDRTGRRPIPHEADGDHHRSGGRDAALHDHRSGSYGDGSAGTGRRHDHRGSRANHQGARLGRRIAVERRAPGRLLDHRRPRRRQHP